MSRVLQHTRVQNDAGKYQDANGVRFDIVSNLDERLDNNNIKELPHLDSTSLFPSNQLQ